MMKNHKHYPLPIKSGRYREALIELSHDETKGLLKLLEDMLCAADITKKILINFENSTITYAPSISCTYEGK